MVRVKVSMYFKSDFMVIFIKFFGLKKVRIKKLVFIGIFVCVSNISIRGGKR